MSTNDIKNNKHYFSLIIIYGIILGIVYGYWMYKKDLPLWADIIVFIAFIAAGIGCAFLSTIYEAKKNKKEAVVESEVKEEVKEETTELHETTEEINN